MSKLIQFWRKNTKKKKKKKKKEKKKGEAFGVWPNNGFSGRDIILFHEGQNEKIKKLKILKIYI
jgi:hypothetical protein